MSPIISLYVAAQVSLSNRIRRMHDDKGAGFVEYAGILLVVGAIAAAVIAASGEDGIGGTIKSQIESAVTEAFSFVGGDE